METLKKIDTQTNHLIFGYMDGEDFIELEDEDFIKEFLKRKDWKEKLIDSINMLIADIKDNVGGDLKDIWERLDKLQA